LKPASNAGFHDALSDDRVAQPDPPAPTSTGAPATPPSTNAAHDVGRRRGGR